MHQQVQNSDHVRPLVSKDDGAEKAGKALFSTTSFNYIREKVLARQDPFLASLTLRGSQSPSRSTDAGASSNWSFPHPSCG